ncbi:hypothetical protein NQ314_011870 [Rhamnusium bicolor]|uniref:Uncharacterized protein n=1 Tax=Rhamnusium bicolor TaxID=1586634 RepID=A0AAV8XG16_9CUCU|nr:hypothetical protein NQ314_011870 [Rhamnusium bicolor]
MKLFVAIFFVASATAGRLENTYLPSSNTATTADSVSVLAAPFNLLPSNRYGAPIPSPGPVYGAPIAAAHFSGSVPSPNALYGAPISVARFAGAVAAPLATVPIQSYSSPTSPPVPILRFNNDNNGDGSYRFDYETANHIAAQESGHLKTSDASEVQGFYSYLAPNGQTISVSYVADENGFRPAGDHLPTPPPIPAAILKSLEINAAEEARGIVDNGQYRPSSAELVATRQYVAPSANSQYLPPVSRGGYKY